MSTIRLQVRDALIVRLNAERDPDIPEATKRRFVPGEHSICPTISLFFLSEVPRQIGGRHGGIIERPLELAVQCVAAADSADATDDLVEPMLAWVTGRLGRAKLDGLVLDIEEVATKWEVVTLDRFYIAATQRWIVNFQTKRDDLNARQ